MRIVSWNIRAGGGRRAASISHQLLEWQPDVVCLCEFRCTPPSVAIAAELARAGLVFQATTAGPEAPRENALLCACRWPFSRLHLPAAPLEPRRWLGLRIDGLGLGLCLVHIPNMATGRKWDFLASVHDVLAGWRGGPALLLGDTNCGWPGDDEETSVFGPRTAAWLDSVEGLGWLDSFRYLRTGERFFTWYSPNAGNGFRLDQAFVNRALLPRLTATDYIWGSGESGRRDALSDHAALIVDLDLPPLR